jgi:hypothetical protein
MAVLAALGLWVQTLARQESMKQPPCQPASSFRAQAFPRNPQGSTSQNSPLTHAARNTLRPVGNITRCTPASLSNLRMAAALNLLVLGGAFACLAQDQPRGTSNITTTPLPTPAILASALWPLQPPAPDECMRAYQTIRAWLDAKGLSPLPSNLPACESACITLRLEGRLMGRGLAIASDAGDRAALARALELAWQQVQAELAQQRANAEDAIALLSIDSIAPRLDLSLELSGAWQPISLQDFKQLDGRIPLGRRGLGVRLAEAAAAAFPEQMLISGNAPAITIGGLISRASGDPALGVERADILARDHRAKFFTFEVAHLAPDWPSGSPQFLTRGTRLAPKPEVADLISMANDLAQHLIRRERATAIEWAIARELKSPREPRRSGIQDFPLASMNSDLEAAALTAIALSRFARTPGVDGRFAADAHECARSQLGILAEIIREKNVDPTNPHELALSIIAATETIGDARPRSLKDLTNADARAIVEVSAQRFIGNDPREPSTPQTMPRITGPISTRGVMSLACVRLARIGLATTDQARAALKSAIESLPPDRLLENMPWLAEAQLELAADGPIETAAGLRELRRNLWLKQWSRDDLPEAEPDLAGLFSPTLPKRSIGHSQAVGSKDVAPLSESARWLTWTAQMLADARLTPAQELGLELSRQLDGLRAIRQAQVTGPMIRWSPSPMHARGGIRQYLWDFELPLDTSTNALLATCETLESLQLRASSNKNNQKNK